MIIVLVVVAALIIAGVLWLWETEEPAEANPDWERFANGEWR